MGTGHRVADLVVDTEMPRTATGSGVRNKDVIPSLAGWGSTERTSRPAAAVVEIGVEPHFGSVDGLGTTLGEGNVILAQDVHLTVGGMGNKGVLRLSRTQFVHG